MKTPKTLEDIHPGVILRDDFMRPMSITVERLATNIDLSPSSISNIVNGIESVTAETALRLGLFFNMEPRFWLNLQSEYDIRIAMRNLTHKIQPRIRIFRHTVKKEI